MTRRPASAPIGAAVFGRGLIVSAASKNASDIATSAAGPAGNAWKNRSYLSVSFTQVPSMPMNGSFLSITSGMAVTRRLVP